LLIAAGQTEKARVLAPSIQWGEPMKIPSSEQRVLLLGNKN